MKLGNIEECQNHATRKSHKKLKKVQTCYVAKDVFLLKYSQTYDLLVTSPEKLYH